MASLSRPLDALCILIWISENNLLRETWYAAMSYFRPQLFVPLISQTLLHLCYTCYTSLSKLCYTLPNLLIVLLLLNFFGLFRADIKFDIAKCHRYYLCKNIGRLG